jgi:NhaA family Na+:H+ antiporter
MFGLAHAGVNFSSIGSITWIVLASLIIGKTIGIFGFGWLAKTFGFGLPRGMRKRDLLVAGIIVRQQKEGGLK